MNHEHVAGQRNESLVSGFFAVIMDVGSVRLCHVDNDFSIVRYFIDDTILHERDPDISCTHIHLLGCHRKPFHRPV